MSFFIFIYNVNMFCLQPLSLFERPHEKKRRDVKQIMSTADTSFNLNKARYEVRQLGINGMSNESKEAAILNKLIQLGAKVRDY